MPRVSSARRAACSSPAKVGVRMRGTVERTSARASRVSSLISCSSCFACSGVCVCGPPCDFGFQVADRERMAQEVVDVRGDAFALLGEFQFALQLLSGFVVLAENTHPDQHQGNEEQGASCPTEAHGRTQPHRKEANGPGGQHDGERFLLGWPRFVGPVAV